MRRSQVSRNPTKKRKTPEGFDNVRNVRHLSSSISNDGRSTSSHSFNSVSREVNVYNGILGVSNGVFSVTRVCFCIRLSVGGRLTHNQNLQASDPRVVQLDATTIPTSSMISRAAASDTTVALDRIRTEVNIRLRGIPGPRVTLVNTRDASSPPLNFRFINDSILGLGVHKADPATIEGCSQCRPHMGQNIGCEYTKKCDCLEYAAVDVARLTEAQKIQYDRYQQHGEGDTSGLPKRFPYYSSESRAGCLVPFYLEQRHPIYECNGECKCGPGCKDRNAQHGRQVELEIFKTKDRGWGERSDYAPREVWRACC